MNTDINCNAASKISNGNSQEFTDNFIKLHTMPEMGVSAQAAPLLATTRLEWMMRRARGELSGRFTSSEVKHLLLTFGGKLIDPCEFEAITGGLSVNPRREPGWFTLSQACYLMDTMCQLDLLQRVTFVDAIEQAWYHQTCYGVPPETTFAELGISLKADTNL